MRINFMRMSNTARKIGTIIAGFASTLRASGPGVNNQRVWLWTDRARRMRGASDKVSWFREGFIGTMGEATLCAIEEDREPSNSARANMKGLAVLPRRAAECGSRFGVRASARSESNTLKRGHRTRERHHLPEDKRQQVARSAPS